MAKVMAGLTNSVQGSLAGRTVSRFLRFSVLRGLRSIEIDPEQFRRQLARKHGLWVPDFRRMKDVPTERLDAIATSLIRDAERLALAEGDRKSTRLNSSHTVISYAVFCLKKKTNE